MSLRFFVPTFDTQAEEAKVPDAVFYDGADLAVFMLSIAHKTSDLTTRYYILLQSSQLLIQDAIIKEFAGMVSPIFGLYQHSWFVNLWTETAV